jgi:hypothetical protein
MWRALAVMVDILHAAAMVSWAVALPLLFVRRWPRLRLACAIYAVSFIVASQASMLLFHECFLTEITSWLNARGTTPMGGGEWFTERVARVVFGMAPSRELISRLSEALIACTAVGVILTLVHARSRVPSPGR